MRSIAVKRLAFAAVAAALAAVFLALTGILPAARIAFLTVSGLFPFTADLVLGRRYSVPAFFAGGILGFLFGAGYAGGLCYLLLFGSYPIFRNLLAGKLPGKKALSVILKLLWFNAVFAILAVLARNWLLPGTEESFTPLAVFLALLAGNAAFLVYDLMIGLAAGWIFRRFDRFFRPFF